MDVPQSRFPLEIVKIIEEIAESHFIAFDLEFSGVAGRRPGGNTGKLSLQDYYDDIKTAAEKYQILQVGLTIVKEDTERGRYIASPYNFNLSPLTTLRERHFAVSFLMKNGFKFDLPLTQGVQYLSRKEERDARNVMIQEDESRSKLADMPPKKDDDILIKHIRTSVELWQAKPKHQQEPYLNIPGEAPGVPEGLNRYQIRLTHQIVRNEYPNLQTAGMGHFVQVTNPTEEQQASQKLAQEKNREIDMSRAVGFRWLMEAIMAGDISKIPDDYILPTLPTTSTSGESRKCFLRTLQEKLQSRRRVLVGHNCFTDLVNLYKCFIGDLPATVDDFQNEIHTLFPSVIDTKYLASFGNKRWSNTSLEDVEAELRPEIIPQIYVPGEHDRYQYASSFHEAGYDSLLTAKIAIKLSAKMEREGKYLEQDRPHLLHSEAALTPFGSANEGCATAAESSGAQPSIRDGDLRRMVNSTPSAPTTALKMAFDKSDIARTLTSTKEGGIPEPDVIKLSTESQTVLVVRENLMSAKRANKREADKIKSTLPTRNIYEVLEKDQAGPEASTNEDLMSFGSASSERGSPQKIKNMGAMVKKGEMMPRWDGLNGFWNLFGNKLQVNGSKEGICRLR